jgi:cytoskeleton protein RodZ
MTKVTQVSSNDDGGTGRRRIHLREISGDSEAALETVGQDLRAARLRRGDDLATVSRSLKIRKDHLEAVEGDNFAGLPGKTYAIGFVRSYSSYLGLDSTQMVERYKQEISGRHDEHHQITENSFQVEDQRRLPYGWRIVAGVVGLALIYGVWHLVSAGPAAQPVPAPPSLSQPRQQVVAAVKPAPPAPPPPAAPATGDTAVPPPEANAAPAQTPQAAQPNNGNLSAGVAAPAPTNGGAVPPPAIATVPPASTTTAAGEIYGQSNLNPRVVLRARGDTKVTVRGNDGKLYLNRDLKAGDSYQVPNVPGLTLATSDAGAVEVTLDGLDKGRVGQNQQILGSVSLDAQSLVERFNSH